MDVAEAVYISETAHHAERGHVFLPAKTLAYAMYEAVGAELSSGLASNF